MACLKESGPGEYPEGRAACDLTLAHRRVNAWLAGLAPSAEGAAIDANAALTDVLDRIEATRLFASGAEIPWYRSFRANLREIVCPEPLPPLELTSTPVAVKDIWGRGTNPKALASSVAFQSAIIAILMLIGTNDAVRTKITQMTLIAPPPAVKPARLKTNRGGGRGQKSPLPPLKGKLPRPMPKVFTPPVTTIDHPALVSIASLAASPDAWAAPAGAIGNPLGVFAGAGGPGKNGGIGTGNGPGIGGNGGNGVGAGDDVGVFNAGNGITRPEVISQVDPEYSEEARNARYSGAVMLSIVVNTDGRAGDIRVVKSLGMGLDQKAVEAVQKWRFRPATNKGVPVRVRAQIMVSFRLL